MNKNLIFYITFLILLHTNVTFAQNTDYAYDLTIEENTLLSDVLNHLESTYQVLFAYDNALIDSIRLSQHQIKQNDFNELLKVLFKDTDLEYKKRGQEILLRKTIQSKSKVISGRILAPNGSALPFATIRLTNTDWGCHADTDGKFSLELPNIDHGSLEISYVGYNPVLINLSNPSSLDFQRIVMQHKQEYISGMIIVEEPSYLDDDQSFFYRRSDSTDQQTPLSPSIDLIQDIKRLPGITAHKDQASGIQIRGGDADESLITLDGITLWTAQHMVGLFSNINHQYIDDFKIYKTVFPAIYGGKTSGVLAFQTDNIIQSSLTAISILAS